MSSYLADLKDLRELVLRRGWEFDEAVIKVLEYSTEEQVECIFEICRYLYNLLEAGVTTRVIFWQDVEMYEGTLIWVGSIDNHITNKIFLDCTRMLRKKGAQVYSSIIFQISDYKAVRQRDLSRICRYKYYQRYLQNTIEAEPETSEVTEPLPLVNEEKDPSSEEINDDSTLNEDIDNLDEGIDYVPSSGDDQKNLPV